MPPDSQSAKRPDGNTLRTTTNLRRLLLVILSGLIALLVLSVAAVAIRHAQEPSNATPPASRTIWVLELN